MLWILTNYLTLNIEALQDDEAFLKFCNENKDYRFERTANGKITIMPPTYTETGGRNFNINVQLGIWLRKNKTGYAFDSSTGFKLPNGSVKSPDTSWVAKERYEALTEKDKKSFAPICPDFVIELKSKTDTLTELKAKMQEYIDNGCQLAWLIDCEAETVYIYTSNETVREHTNFKQPLSGEPVLKGFELDLEELL